MERARDVSGLAKAAMHPKRVIRQASARALLRLDAADVLIQMGQQGLRLLVQELKDSDESIRRLAIVALERTENPGVIRPLTNVLLNDSDWEARREAIQALARIDGGRAAESLVEALGDEVPQVRQAAIEALMQIGEPAIKVLFALTKSTDVDIKVRYAAAEVLLQIPQVAIDPEALIAILKGVEQDSQQVEKCDISSFQDTSVELLIAALSAVDSDVRRAAAEKLGQIKDVHAIEPLSALLGDSNSQVRLAAAEALHKLSWEPKAVTTAALYCIAKREWNYCVRLGNSAVEPLIAALGDADSSVCQDAAKALAQIGDQRALGPIIEAFTRVNEQTDWEIVEILRQFDTLQIDLALEKLGQHLAVCIDDDPESRSVIKLFLEKEAFRVFLSANGTEGLDLIRLVNPDIVLLDRELLGLDSLEVYRQMKIEDQIKHIPILGVSATSRANAGEFGRCVDGWLEKPLDRPRLHKAIERLLFSKGRVWE
jgi:HEAT repeat protein